jgi:hypothetical protein
MLSRETGSQDGARRIIAEGDFHWVRGFLIHRFTETTTAIAHTTRRNIIENGHMHHPSFTWMVQQQYVARLAAVQQVSSGNPHKHLDGPAKEYSSSTCNNPARLEPSDGAWFMHDASFSDVICILFSAQPFWSGTHDFSLDGAHRFSALCLRVAIAILPCMSEGKGEK